MNEKRDFSSELTKVLAGTADFISMVADLIEKNKIEELGREDRVKITSSMRDMSVSLTKVSRIITSLLKGKGQKDSTTPPWN